MSWTLKKSRDLFYAETGQPRGQAFWIDEAVSMSGAGVEPNAIESAIAWNAVGAASRANCPLLHDVMVELSSIVDPRWKARVDNIYAGRTVDGDNTAFSRGGVKGGMVAISIHYSQSLIAYAGAWGQFLYAVDSRTQFPAEDWACLMKNMRDDLAQLMSDFQDRGLAVLSKSWPVLFRDARQRDAVGEIVASAERWIVAHEVAHHILRHASSKIDEDAAREVRSFMAAPAMRVELVGLSRDQVQEIEADLLAFELVAGRFAKDTNALIIMQGVVGALLATIAVGHLDGGWATSPDSEHPGAFTRIAVLAKWITLEHGDSPLAELPGANPGMTFQRLTAILLTYALWASGEEDVHPYVGSADDQAAVDDGEPVWIQDYLFFALQLGMLEADDETPLIRQP
ncbi:hypothetical protein [Kribbella kalugense]|uniref:Peptidase U49-like protein n=1 Tax=Kribbella kalugense TaxID=2512221 RepID=A0A4R7ZWP7_9ACTN|nr:hypothetical protein [Kribbella kalugense]TDW22126.1 hypothetical protein EV650_0959 [Kribbella kalugense]